MGCINSIVNPNETSILYDELEKIDGKKAVNWLNYVKSPEFIEIFGDYKAAHIDEGTNPYKDRVYVTGEPMLFYNKALRKHYFKLEDGEKYYYPHDRVGLDGLFTSNEKNALVSSIALAYAQKSGLKLDIDSLVATEKNDQPLIDFIDDFLDNLITDLNDDFMTMGLASSVEESMLFTKDWVKETKEWFKKEQITVTTEEAELADLEEKTEQAEEPRGELIRIAAFLKNSKDNMAGNTKLFLSLIESTKKNEFGRYTFVPFNDIYSTLNKTLANTVAVPDESGSLEDIYDVYVEKIEKLVGIKPWANNLLEKLRDKNITKGRSKEQLELQEQFKNQFVSAFNLHRNLFLGTEIAKNGKKVSVSVKILSDVGSRQTSILSQWFENFSKADKQEDLEAKLNN